MKISKTGMDVLTIFLTAMTLVAIKVGMETDSFLLSTIMFIHASGLLFIVKTLIDKLRQ